MRPHHYALALFLVSALLLGMPRAVTAETTTDCSATVLKLAKSKNDFAGTATVRVKRSQPGRSVEIVLDAIVEYRYPDGTDSTFSLTRVHIPASENKSETVTFTVRPDITNPDLWVSSHCPNSERCKIIGVEVQEVVCWDYDEKPEGRVEVGG